jgi:hypothetical protein
MKNRATPLAAALVLAAASAQTATSSDPDRIFKCSTPPFSACTPAEDAQRNDVLRSRDCSTMPGNTKCVDYLMKNGGGNPIENYSASTLPDGHKWTNPDCTRIPCQITSTTPEQKSSPILFPLGPDQDPQPFADDAAFQNALKQQEEATPGKVIDLGNRRFAVDVGDGQFSIGGTIDGVPANGMPKNGAQIPGLKEVIEAKVANLTMFKGTADGGTPPAIPNGTSPVTNGTTPSGYNDGVVVAGNQEQIGGGNKGSGGPGEPDRADGGAIASGTMDTISIDGQTIEISKIPITYVLHQKTQELILNAAAAHNNGNIPGLTDANGKVGGTVDGRPADPPVDPNQLGKIQAVKQ